MRRFHLSSVLSVSFAALVVSGAIASAACVTIATDQTCTNDEVLDTGIIDHGTLQLTNTENGFLGGFVPSVVDAVHAQVRNDGSMFGMFDGLTVAGTLELLNDGAITANMGTAISADEAFVDNAGELNASGVGISATTALELVNVGQIHAREQAIVAGEVDITNDGDILSLGVAAIETEGGGTIVNNGSIASGSYFGGTAIIRSGDDLSVTNAGNLLGYDNGIEVAGRLLVTNTGMIQARYGALAAEHIALRNSGFIVATEASEPYDIAWGTAIYGPSLWMQNDAGGFIYSAIAAVVARNATVINAGTIVGDGEGVWAHGLMLDNLGTGVIQSERGAAVEAAQLSLDNAGLIGGHVGVAGGRGLISNSGHIYGVAAGITSYHASPNTDTPWDPDPASPSDLFITNSGEIRSPNAAITLNSLSLTNEAGGRVIGQTIAVQATDDAYVTNRGLIAGRGEGIAAERAFITNSGTIRVGGQAVSGHGLLSLTNSGTVISTGDIAVVGDNAYITNSGSIRGIDNAIAGLDISLGNTGSVRAEDTAVSGDFVVVSNEASGLIAGAVGIDGADSLFLNNSGRIIGGNVGVSMGDVGAIANSAGGRISGGDYGISAATLGHLANHGQIRGGFAGIEAEVVAIENHATGRIDGDRNGIIAFGGRLANDGLITGGANGVSLQGAAQIVNAGHIGGGSGTGLIAGSGYVINRGLISGTTGLRVTGASNVVNSGLIAGNGGTAISYRVEDEAARNTLRLVGDGRVDGIVRFSGGTYAIDLVGTETRLDIRGLDRTRAAIATGGRPYVVSPTAIQIYDPAGISAGATNVTLGDMTRQVAALLPSGAAMPAIPADRRVTAAFDSLLGRERGAPSTALGYAATPSAMGGAMTDAAGNRLWSNAFGLYREQDSTRDAGLGGQTRGYGGVIGYERRLAPDLLIGGFAGAGRYSTVLDANSGWSATTTGFAGAYVSKTWGPWFADAVAMGGILKTDNERRFISGGTTQRASSSHDGWYLNPGLTVGAALPLGERVKLVPTLKARYLYASLDGYRETGSNANMRVNQRRLQAFEERAELSLVGTQALANGTTLKVTATGGVFATQRVEGSELTGSLLGQTVRFTNPGKSSVVGYTAALAAEWQVSEGLSLFGAGDFSAASDHSRTLGGKLGVQMRF